MVLLTRLSEKLLRVVYVKSQIFKDSYRRSYALKFPENTAGYFLSCPVLGLQVTSSLLVPKKDQMSFLASAGAGVIVFHSLLHGITFHLLVKHYN
jgi:hypothetical protein